MAGRERFVGKVALITGGGGGIGAATAQLIAAEGGAVVVVGRTAATIEATAAAIVAAGGRALAVVADVSREDAVEVAFARAVAAFGRLDVVVVNAAVQLHRRDKPIHEQDFAAWQETQAINLGGAFLTCRAGVRQLLAQGEGGALVIVSSVTALAGTAAQNPAYTTPPTVSVATSSAPARWQRRPTWRRSTTSRASGDWSVRSRSVVSARSPKSRR